MKGKVERHGSTARRRARDGKGRPTIHGPVVVAVILLVHLVVPPAPAQAQTVADKAGRGLAGMTTAFLEVPGNMVAETRKRGTAEGVPVGFAKGLGMIVPRVLVGVYEFVTAPVPAPAGYRPVIQPEYPWDYFEGRRTRPRSATRAARKSA